MHTYYCDRVTCHADGTNYVDPELFLNNQRIDEQYLTRNWPTDITLSVESGIVDENLIGYFSCKTRGDTFNSSHIIHHCKLVYFPLTHAVSYL